MVGQQRNTENGAEATDADTLNHDIEAHFAAVDGHDIGAGQLFHGISLTSLMRACLALGCVTHSASAHRMATFSSFASMVPLPSVSKRSKASLQDARHFSALGVVPGIGRQTGRCWEIEGGGSFIGGRASAASGPDLLLLLFCEALALVRLLILASGCYCLSVALHGVCKYCLFDLAAGRHLNMAKQGGRGTSKGDGHDSDDC